MPESRHRHRHHVHHRSVTTHHTHPRIRRSAAFVVSVIVAVLGLAVAYFTQGADLLWIATGTVVGDIIGYLVGRSMDKSIEKS